MCHVTCCTCHVTINLVRIAGSDYTSTVMELVFSAAVRSHVVRVPITQDNISELNEQFRASVLLVENNGINVVVDPGLATVTIKDDDGERATVSLITKDLSVHISCERHSR